MLRSGSSPDELREHEGEAPVGDKPQEPDSGFRCVWANDWDKYACRVYRSHWNDGTLREGNVEAVDADGLPDFDLLTAGFPCQSFSFAGRRKGFGDVRGTLFFSVARVAEAKRPKVVLLENVKGLLSAQRGYCFWTVLRVLEELGYWVEWQVLNSRHFGVPQNRERVFVVGHLGGAGGREVFPITENSSENEKMEVKRKPISKCLRARGQSDPHSGLQLIMLSHTKANIRRLTPTECERLQGFPDGWTQRGVDVEGNEAGISDTQRYKMLGNAVTVNVVEFLGRRMMERCFSG